MIQTAGVKFTLITSMRAWIQHQVCQKSYSAEASLHSTNHSLRVHPHCSLVLLSMADSEREPSKVVFHIPEADQSAIDRLDKKVYIRHVNDAFHRYVSSNVRFLCV